MNIDFGSLITQAATESGIALKSDAAAVTAYANERVAHLQTIANEPGFEEAMRAEALAVAIFAAIDAVDLADGQDARLVKVAFGLLTAALA